MGGEFREVKNLDTDETFSQPYLAAFDANTGEWISPTDPPATPGEDGQYRLWE